MAESSPNRLKPLWENEKLLVTSNFFFFHSVFKRLLLQTRKNQGLFGKGLTQHLSSESALNLDTSDISSFGKALEEIGQYASTAIVKQLKCMYMYCIADDTILD